VEIQIQEQGSGKRQMQRLEQNKNETK